MEVRKLFGKGVAASAAGGLLTAIGRNSASAQDVASAGNGGVATASANGGAVSIGAVNSGGNTGNAIALGDTVGGEVLIDGGTVSSSTSLTVSANGGVALADASGGDGNFAFVS